MKNDNSLISGIRSGDRSAFHQVYILYYDLMINYAYGLVGSVDVARDMVTSIFAHIWHGRDDFAPKGTIRGFLLTQVKNSAIDYNRADTRWTRSWLTVQADGIGNNTSSGSSLQEHESDSGIADAINRIGGVQREIMFLRWRANLDATEIALTLRISEAAVNSQITDILGSIRDRLMSHV